MIKTRVPRSKMQSALLPAREVQRPRGDVDTSLAQTSKDLDALRQEVQRLARRVQHLEQLVKHQAQAATRAVPAQTPPSSAKSLFTFLGRPSLTSLS